MKSFIVSLLFVLATVSVSFALPLVSNGDIVSLSGSPSGAVNGDFQVEVNHAGTVAFATFCVEKGTHFSLGHDYYATVNDTIENGYITLNDGVKYLYWNFVNDSLVSSFDVTSQFDVAELQDAIWYLQAGTSVVGNRFFDETNAANLALASTYNVSVMNLWTDYNAPYDIGCGDRQSQLIINEVTPVPEPASLVLMGAGILVIGVARRFRR